MAATPVSDLRASLKRQINVTGAENLPDLTNNTIDGHILDGFWTARLRGMLSEYTTDGTNIYKTSDATEGIPEQLRMLVILFSAFHLVRSRILQLAVNFRAKAGPAEYEQNASATVLRALLESLEREIRQLEENYSNLLPSGAFTYMDGVLQAEYAALNNLAELTVIP